MAFDDLKKFRGKVYSGMPVGGTHAWEYRHGLWREQKVAPDRWAFSFISEKKRVRKAPEGSGALPGTEYHWFILAHQRVEKLDADTYSTVMEGVKYKVAHKRPHWRRWSTEYPDNEPERETLIRILTEQLEELEKGGGRRPGISCSGEDPVFTGPSPVQESQPGGYGLQGQTNRCDDDSNSGKTPREKR